MANISSYIILIHHKKLLKLIKNVYFFSIFKKQDLFIFSLFSKKQDLFIFSLFSKNKICLFFLYFQKTRFVYFFSIFKKQDLFIFSIFKKQVLFMVLVVPCDKIGQNITHIALRSNLLLSCSTANETRRRPSRHVQTEFISRQKAQGHLTL